MPDDFVNERSGPFGLLLLRIYAVVVALLGAAMLLGGIWLLMLGGSPYYALAGAIIVIAAVQLVRRKRSGAWLFGAAVALTMAWAVYEVGFDGWALMPRLLALLALGSWLLMPWTQRALMGGSFWSGRSWGAAAVIVGAAGLSLAIGLSLHVLIVKPGLSPDPRFQAGLGAFPQAKASSAEHVGGGVKRDWPEFGGDAGGSRFSALDQISAENVTRLEVAWTADVGTLPGSSTHPIKVGSTLYTCNNRNEVFALDAVTGEHKWSHDASNGYGGSCRGVSFYEVPGGVGLCSTRILTATNSAQLRALDAGTGKLCQDFGESGIVDLTVGMGDAAGNVVGGYYRVRGVPTIVRGKAIIGGWISDNQYWGQASGVVRAFDAITGELSWAWDMGRPDRSGAPPDGEHYTHSTPNSWAPMSADEELGYVFVPTGNAPPDFFGGNRREFDEQYSSSVVALSAQSGKVVWSFQTRHHDLWDHDVASQPTLVDLPGGDGGTRKALVQPTKQGEVFVIDRETGEAIFDVVERPVPQQGRVPEERLSPTQPFSEKLPSFRGHYLREADMWGISPLDQLMCRIAFRKARYEGPNTPPGLTPSIVYPSTFGALNWGSVSVDPLHKVMIVNSTRMATLVRMIPRAKADQLGVRRLGEFASDRDVVNPIVPMENTPYALEKSFWVTKLGMPCIAPPYGFISAVDLNSGKLLWSKRFGTARGNGPAGMKFPFAIPIGTPNHGGSLITGSGLVFIGATPDGFLHAYDLRSGDLLWKAQLPGGGNALPISYEVAGRQYIVIMAGGSLAIGANTSTKLVAFALP
ncbi:MAG: membrane-bound PQQ-dependent dehydrogenase, glucose/quinate/shikimate family [Sphingomonadaceae bacterium]|nr:membrane-bound PQQ-dependent dehydrogenase, glucose/quinate/shikimate family [Sphingomonadaceae bacterium]